MASIDPTVRSVPEGGAARWAITDCAPCTTIAGSPPVNLRHSPITGSAGTTANVGNTFGPRPSYR
jgi:hypothetical protein